MYVIYVCVDVLLSADSEELKTFRRMKRLAGAIHKVLEHNPHSTIGVIWVTDLDSAEWEGPVMDMWYRANQHARGNVLGSESFSRVVERFKEEQARRDASQFVFVSRDATLLLTEYFENLVLVPEDRGFGEEQGQQLIERLTAH